ncbi:hypothetical protein AB0J63_49370 [Streptosporangium canum]|uniref:hypothetical protein n=1 Tax=Streptosporangium canum TaxID=324952 RepID=UPI0034355C4A
MRNPRLAPAPRLSQLLGVVDGGEVQTGRLRQQPRVLIRQRVGLAPAPHAPLQPHRALGEFDARVHHRGDVGGAALGRDLLQRLQQRAAAQHGVRVDGLLRLHQHLAGVRVAAVHDGAGRVVLVDGQGGAGGDADLAQALADPHQRAPVGQPVRDLALIPAPHEVLALAAGALGQAVVDLRHAGPQRAHPRHLDHPHRVRPAQHRFSRPEAAVSPIPCVPSFHS